MLLGRGKHEQMNKRKYITEYAIAYKNTRWCTVTAHQLMSDGTFDKESQEVADNSHIYFITSRPASYFKEGSLKHKDNKLSGEIGYRVNGVEKILQFNDYPFELYDGATRLAVDPYPHRNIWTYNDESEKVRYLPSGLLANIYDEKSGLGVFNHYEVLYVGQAFGDGSRSAQERLQSHATLQKILARTAHEYPDQEIIIFMLEFDFEQLISGMDGRAVGAIDTDENESRMFKAIDNPPSKKQKISLIEAGLIRYFQPHYNETFKIKFPSTKLKTLQSCYDLDISGLIVELDTSELNFYLYSQTVKPHWVHFAKYDLVSAHKRASFFSNTGFKEMPGVIKTEK